MKVCIEDIADELEMCMDGWEQFLNTKTGEVVALADGMWVERDEELEEEIENSDYYIRLPNQYEIHEWNIMKDFADTVSLEKQQERLLRALHGRKAYRHFKDEIINMGMEEDYYKYRFTALCKIAREWCEEHQIPYIVRRERVK